MGLKVLFNLYSLIGVNKLSPYGSVGRVAGLRTGGHWFDPRLGQYYFRELMIVIAHRCPLFRQWLCRKAASGLENIVLSTGLKKKKSRKAWIGALATAI